MVKKTLRRMILEHLLIKGPTATPDLEIACGVGRRGLSSPLRHLEDHGFVSREVTGRGGRLTWTALKSTTALEAFTAAGASILPMGWITNHRKVWRQGKTLKHHEWRKKLARDVTAFEEAGGAILILKGPEAPVSPRADAVRRSQ